MNPIILAILALFSAATAALACDPDAARLCQEAYWTTVNQVCPLSHDPEGCRNGALDRYDSCKAGAGCR